MRELRQLAADGCRPGANGVAGPLGFPYIGNLTSPSDPPPIHVRPEAGRRESHAVRRHDPASCARYDRPSA
jgi:hypothetical protein